ncbi:MULTISPECIES: FprA family A-type flavoprotein [Caproicibacterium]|uniref:FprA family A-type flavoprotein n=1 Tax=Caproicibacterium argilliputei TaxID=3030016 RepID=A0AA97D7U9_9FIRM|nr:FprA family A-type flavoprotein [Caproicibacterium argilliputei]WOC31841.1 FprA family A-type flavoprotein [Caproicibacterium argilliputei]
MFCTQKITEDIDWVGGSDRRLALFENLFPLPDGMSYNAYLVKDQKTALMDTADASVSAQFLENVEHALGGRTLDYLVANHMEPDHCAMLADIVRRWPQVKLVGNKKTFQLIRQFFDFPLDAARCVEVKEGDTLELGRHKLRFLMTPMVHWPEVMMTYDETDKALFCADAFGTFGAFHGPIFADELDFPHCYLDEARRYYANIVGKYGPQVQMALKKTKTLQIERLCSLHGPVWRKDIGWFLQKYDLWSRYEPEEQGVLVAYGSMYGHTANMAELLASMLAEKGVTHIHMYDVSKTDKSYIISDAFRFSNLVFAAPTYNNGLYLPMETLLQDMAALNLQNRRCTLLGNGSWAPVSAKKMQEQLATMKAMQQVGEPLQIRSSLKKEQVPQLEALAQAVADSMRNA